MGTGGVVGERVGNSEGGMQEAALLLMTGQGRKGGGSLQLEAENYHGGTGRGSPAARFLRQEASQQGSAREDEFI